MNGSRFQRSELKSLVDVVGTELCQALQHGVSAARGQVFAKETQVGGDVVTDVDFAIQTRLERFLTELLPGSGFIGEENFLAVTGLDDAPKWIVDPLDGTLNYASRLPFFGASVALIVDRQPVLAVVVDHGSAEIFDAYYSGGARLNGRQFTWNPAMAARSPVGISSGYLAQMTRPPVSNGPNYAAAFLGERFRIFGSQAIQLCWAAEGRLKLNINVETKLWDDAAGYLICNEAGAKYASIACSPLFPLNSQSPALAGQNLFSIAGTPVLVDLAQMDFMKAN